MASWGGWSHLGVKGSNHTFGFDPWACPDTMALQLIYPCQPIRWCFLAAHPELQHDVPLLDEFGPSDPDLTHHVPPSHSLTADYPTSHETLKLAESPGSSLMALADGIMFLADRVDAYLENDVS